MPDFKETLEEYIKKYDELLDKSRYFKKGVFNHNNASVIAKNLKDNGFFNARHSISLNSGSSKEEISTEDELEEIIAREKEAIMSNPELRERFDELDKKLNSNRDLRDFREYLLNNLEVITELGDLNNFKRKLWISYLKINKESYNSLVSEYNNGKSEIEIIIRQAREEETKWKDVIAIFNKRFSVPFGIFVENQEDVILKSEGPNIKFTFNENGNTTDIEEGPLLKVLSAGEKRALYLLNIIFEVEARKTQHQQTLFIIDDIADSFDYKNKYAIIEYLKDISEETIFYQIVLTHNFDFYRTVCSRLDMSRRNKLHAIRNSDGIISLNEEKYQNNNPFMHWKGHLDRNEMLIASIPFVRNIAEFSGYDVHKLKLTSLLHYKEDTESITIEDLESIYKDILKDKSDLSLSNKSQKIIELIFQTAESICEDSSDAIDLENKIVLSIAIRIKAEKYMISQIDDNVFWRNISNNQTWELFKKFSEIQPGKHQERKLLDQVRLMTPENIHINSFMYEPILDMSSNHLKRLLADINELQ